jgi:hypothetical protein
LLIRGSTVPTSAFLEKNVLLCQYLKRFIDFPLLILIQNFRLKSSKMPKLPKMTNSARKSAKIANSARI